MKDNLNYENLTSNDRSLKKTTYFGKTSNWFELYDVKPSV